MPLGEREDSGKEGLDPRDEGQQAPSAGRGEQQTSDPNAQAGEGTPDFEKLYRKVDRRNRSLLSRLRKLEAQLEGDQERQSVAQQPQFAAPVQQQPGGYPVVAPLPGAPQQPAGSNLTAQEQHELMYWQNVVHSDPDRSFEAMARVSAINAQAAARQARTEAAAEITSRFQAAGYWGQAVKEFPDVEKADSEIRELAEEIFSELDPRSQADPRMQLLAVRAAAGQLAASRKGQPASSAPPRAPVPQQGMAPGTQPPARPDVADDLRSGDEGTRKGAIRTLARNLASDFLKQGG